MKMRRRCKRPVARAVRANRVHGPKLPQLPVSQGGTRQTQFLPFLQPCWGFCTWYLDLGKTRRRSKSIVLAKKGSRWCLLALC